MRFRILDYAWHQGHSYRLHALPADFWYLDVRRDLWNLNQRPKPENFRGPVHPRDVDLSKFDLALVHLDQWCDGRHNLRALPFRVMIQTVKGRLPTVLIMHGTPESDQNRENVLRLIGDLPVVCNSLEAAAVWDAGEERWDRYGLPQFRAIIHGYDVDEFASEPFGSRLVTVVTVCGGGNWSYEYHGMPMMIRMMRDLPLLWYGHRGNRKMFPTYADYRAMLARSLIYFSPTTISPMPGSRTEAMLSGCCVVTMPGHDIENYIEDGKTGLLVKDYAQARDVLQALTLQYPEIAYKIGQAGREAARVWFDKGRFVEDWLTLLKGLGVTGGG